jgi:hypothetical protein
MSNINDKKTFFGLTTLDKERVVKEAVNLANKDQLDLVNRHGGIEVIKNYCKCN